MCAFFFAFLLLTSNYKSSVVIQVLQNLGKADKTCDNDFAEVKDVFLEQQVRQSSIIFTTRTVNESYFTEKWIQVERQFTQLPSQHTRYVTLNIYFRLHIDLNDNDENSAANEALRNLHDSMNVMYEPQIGRAEQFKFLTQVLVVFMLFSNAVLLNVQDSESAWDQYVGRNDKLFQNVNNYCSPFPQIRVILRLLFNFVCTPQLC